MHIKRPLCLYSAVFALLLCLLANIFPPKLSDMAEKNADRALTLTGNVSKKEIKNNKLRLYIEKVDGLNGLIADLDMDKYRFEDIKVGSRIKISGLLSLYDEPVNEGQFDYRRYYLIRNIHGKLENPRIVAVSMQYSHYREYLACLRQKAERVFQTYMSDRDAGIMEALVLGDKNDLDSDVKDLYQAAGISHVLSLSGLHIAAVGLFTMKILKKTGLSGVICASLSMALMISYSLLTGMSVSTQRALFMFSLAIIAELIGRTYDLLSAAALSSVYMLIQSPYLIMDTGFLLSFLAVVAIGIVYPAFAGVLRPGDGLEMVKEYRTGISEKLYGKISSVIDGVIVSFAIFFTTLPVVALSFYRVSLYSFAANLIVIPLMSILLASGFSGLAIGMLQYLKIAEYFSTIPVFSGVVTPGILKISKVILKLYEGLSERISALDGNILVTGRPSTWQVITYYLMLCVVICLCYSTPKSPKSAETVDYMSRRKNENNIKYFRKFLNKITPRKVLVVVLLTISVVTLTHKNRSQLEIRNLSVGQGDCAVIMGSHTPVIVIDGGSTDVKNVGKYRIIPALLANGIDDVDYMFISHLDADHYNGLMEILKNNTCGIKVKRIVISSLAGEGSVEAKNKLAELEQLTADAGCKLYRMGQGDVINAGGIKLTCLYPMKARVIDKSDGLVDTSAMDSNNTSLVLRVDCDRYDFSALFTGDISSDAERLVSQELLNCDYLKVAHHGSRYSTSEDFLKRVSPSIAVISVGKDNCYGHPHKETLERFDKYIPNTKVLRTDECGQITVKTIGDAIAINRFTGANMKNTLTTE